MITKEAKSVLSFQKAFQQITFLLSQKDLLIFFFQKYKRSVDERHLVCSLSIF